MNGQEFATAVQYDLPIIVVVVDNGMYGTIRMHQEREYPGRVSATELKNPDFAASPAPTAAMASGSRRTDRVRAGLSSALSRRASPAILHVLIDPEAITPATTLTAMREKALAEKR